MNKIYPQKLRVGCVSKDEGKRNIKHKKKSNQVLKSTDSHCLKLQYSTASTL